MLKRSHQKFGRLLGAVFLTYLIILPTVAQAIDTYSRLSTPFYDPLSDSSCSINLDLSLSGNSSEEQAYNFFVSRGLTAQQAAGVVGNMKWESGLDPTNIQDPGGDSQNPNDAGSGGWGIVQWTPGNSKPQGVKSDAGVGGPIYELATQLQMVWAQLSGKAGGYSESQAGSDIKGAQTIEDAVRAFQGDANIGGHYTGFERPKDEQATLQKRIDFANQIYQAFGGSSAGTSSTVASGGGCGATGPGQNTQYIGNFAVYSQYDAQWADDKYGDTTIAAAGCGPSAMAMIISALTGTPVTPDQTAAYADSQGLYVPGAGSSWDIGRVLANHWGLKATPVGDDISKISASLQNGSLIIAAGKGAVPFTSGGHFLVIRGVTADGKWKVGDSGHSNTSSKEWDPNQLLDSIRSNGSQGSIYAISK